ncbi:MAG: hypothetical protein AAGC55_23095 [Myxococcota bacterium]
MVAAGLVFVLAFVRMDSCNAGPTALSSDAMEPSQDSPDHSASNGSASNGSGPAPADAVAARGLAEAALAAGEDAVIVGIVDLPPAGGAAPAPPGASPLAVDDAHYQAWAVRVDRAGDVAWQRVYRGPRESYARAIVAQPGGFVVVGEYREGPRREYRGWLLGIDDSGDERWRRVLGRPGRAALNAAVALSPPAAPDAPAGPAVIAAGTEGGQGWIVACDRSGAPLWQQTFDEVDHFSAAASLGEVVVVAGIAGRTTTAPGRTQLIALRPTGERVWTTQLSEDGPGEIAALAALSDGRAVAVGHRRAADGARSGAWVVLFDRDGTVLASSVVPGPHRERARAVVARADGGFALAATGFKRRKAQLDG